VVASLVNDFLVAHLHEHRVKKKGDLNMFSMLVHKLEARVLHERDL
jgi:hypothetical protein